MELWLCLTTLYWLLVNYAAGILYILCLHQNLETETWEEASDLQIWQQPIPKKVGPDILMMSVRHKGWTHRALRK